MNYAEALDWLYATQRHGIKLGLENVRRLLDALDWHGREQRFLHVAGTNGKGSVCAMLDAICRAQGLRTGLFISPHLVTFRERIRIDGEVISENDVTRGLSKIRALVSDWETHPTFFEITTALALTHFQNERADVVVLETGMGGRLDATNVVTPQVSIITKIDLDHQQWLGATLTEIAAEKAGIIKPRVPVISAPQTDEVSQVLCEAAVQHNAKLMFVEQPLAYCEVALAGNHQRLNAAIALAALRSTQIEVSDEAVRAGLKSVLWPGRFQQIQNPKSKIQNEIVLDGAHNPAAAAQLAQTWREVYSDERATVIVGILNDKDIAGICAALRPIAASFIATPVRNPRTSSPADVCTALDHTNCITASGLAEALEIAARDSRKILVTGSLFLVGEALAHFGMASLDPEITSQ